MADSKKFNRESEHHDNLSYSGKGRVGSDYIYSGAKQRNYPEDFKPHIPFGSNDRSCEDLKRK